MCLKKCYQVFAIVMSVAFLQACAVTDKQQNQWLQSGQSLINRLHQQPLTEQELATGFKQLLSIGSDRVVNQLGRKNAYLNDEAIHITLPKNLQKVHNSLKKVGLEKYTIELEEKMNRAAEVAAPKAKKLFWNAIKDMRWQDVKSIYQGEDNSATLYFKNKMSPSLRKMLFPVINKTLADVGVVKLYKNTLKKYHTIPFVPPIKDDLETYVLEKSIEGIFFYLEKEEAAIRNNPQKRTTELLKRMFSN